MAVDLNTLIPSLQREVDAPGSASFPDATATDWLGHLQDAFWEIRLDGLLTNYTEAGGSVTPVTGSTELPREWQQLIVFYAGFRIIRNTLRNVRTSLRSKAGPVEFETQQSANALVEILKELRAKRDSILGFLSSRGMVTDHYIDAVAARYDPLYTEVTYGW